MQESPTARVVPDVHPERLLIAVVDALELPRVSVAFPPLVRVRLPDGLIVFAVLMTGIWLAMSTPPDAIGLTVTAVVARVLLFEFKERLAATIFLVVRVVTSIA